MRVLLIKSKSKGGISSHIQHILVGLKTNGIQFMEHETNYNLLKLTKDIMILKKKISTFRPDIIHIHGYKALFYAFFMPKDIKVVITFHGFVDNLPKIKRGLFKLFLRQGVKKADKIICVSHKLADASIRDLKLNPEKVSVIYNGVKNVDIDRINKKNNSNIQEINLGACGRFTKAKGFDILIKAFNNIKEKFPVKLHLIGDGPDEDLLRKQASDKVIFHGYQEDPLELMKEWDYFIQPSRTEGCGIAVLEAMSLNLPVLISDAGGLPELITNELHGLIFQKESVNDLTRCLTMVLSNKDLYHELGVTNNKWVLKHFSIASMLSKTLNLYEELMGEEIYEEIL